MPEEPKGFPGVESERQGFETTKRIRELEKKYRIKESDRHYICGHSSEINRGVEEECFLS